VDEGDHFFSVRKRSVRKTHPHAAEADGGDFKIAFSKFAFLHCFSFYECDKAPKLDVCRVSEYAKPGLVHANMAAWAMRTQLCDAI
jgi:hypothetical protein